MIRKGYIIFLGITPIIGIGSFVSDILYINSESYYLRETLTLGTFLLAFFLIPILMTFYYLPLFIYLAHGGGFQIFYSFRRYLAAAAQ